VDTYKNNSILIKKRSEEMVINIKGKAEKYLKAIKKEYLNRGIRLSYEAIILILVEELEGKNILKIENIKGVSDGRNKEDN